MLIGDPETKENFKYLSKHGIRSMGAVFLEKSKNLEDLVASVPENTITGFHLKDIFDTTKKYTEIKKKIYECIMFNKRFPLTLNHKFIHFEEDEEEEKQEASKIKFDLVKFFTDIGAPECITKLQKQDLLDPELFFKIEMGTLEGFLELKPEGKKIKITKKINEIREKYEKEGKIEYIDMGLLEECPDDLP